MYTIARNQDRQQRCTAMMRKLQFTDWSFVYGSEGKQHYWQNVHEDYVELLKTPAPFLLLEDDSTTTQAYHATLEYPDDAQHLFVGGNSCALGYTEYDDNWLRIRSMYCGHAMLFIDEATKELIREILNQRRDVPIDVAISDNLARFRGYCLKAPFWYQQDGHNDWSTQHYYPRRTIDLKLIHR
jgi:hypothetical protein